MRLSEKDFPNNIRFANSFLCNNKKDHIIKSTCSALSSAEFIIHECQLNYAEQRIKKIYICVCKWRKWNLLNHFNNERRVSICSIYKRVFYAIRINVQHFLIKFHKIISLKLARLRFSWKEIGTGKDINGYYFISRLSDNTYKSIACGIFWSVIST